MSIEDFIIYVSCCVAEEYDSIVGASGLRRSGYAPKLSDSGAITMELVGEFLSIDTDKGRQQYFRSHWQSWFPKLGLRSNFAKQVSQLCQIKQVILQRITARLGAFPDTIHLVDERDSLRDLTDSIHGLLIGDKAYIHLFLKEELSNQHISLQTPLRSNMKDSRPKSFVRQLISFRRLVETVIARLTLRFNIQKVWARDLFHLTNRIVRKLLSHTVAVSFKCSLGNLPLLLDSILN